MTVKVQWVKSRRCDTNACVEVADRGDAVLVRNSSDTNGPTLVVSHDAWDGLLAWIKETGGFVDPPATA